MTDDEVRTLAERVRQAVIEEGLAGWEEAGVAGLCGEGQFEAAVGRMRGFEVGELVELTEEEEE